MNSLERMPLASKIIIDRKLYQFVVYFGKGEVQRLANKFENSEYILEEIESNFSQEYLDCYFLEMPQLTRLYIVCREEELSRVQECI